MTLNNQLALRLFSGCCLLDSNGDFMFAQGVKIKDNINLVAKVGESREVQILNEVLGDPMVYFNVDRCIKSIIRSITVRVQHSHRKEVVTFRQNELSKSKESHDLGFTQIGLTC
ncbi:hypothetical protein H5410_003607 [Solanum commersonii]|uniref:Uncharacterized protein n=1 Tax=Solanum commersonii TaxID=4109 RepID=A0A9J6B5K5_SOLCO|nr:hypothetical protein H5410_003607 [Solanum commersonii]